MTEIVRHPEGANSPEMADAEALGLALTLRDRDALAGRLAADCIWSVAGRTEIRGASAVLDAIGAPAGTLASITVEHVSAHGCAAAIGGAFVTGKGEAWRFAHLLDFTSASTRTLLRIETFAIKAAR